MTVLLYESLKIAKLLSVALLFTGTIGAVLPRALEDRRRFAYWIAGPAFATTWLFGFLLAFMQQTALVTWWVITAIVLSLFSLQVVLFSVGVEGRRNGTVATLAVLPLVGCVAVMVMRAHG
jgi:hypothetical protein